MYDDGVRGSLIGLLVLAACYHPTIPAGVVCSAGGECPEGQMCIGGVCTFGGGAEPDGGGAGPDSGGAEPDGGIDGAVQPAADRDVDTVADDNDNCPDKANTDQADEDNDRRGDVCDLCPQIAGEAATDSDGDGIGDACDPHPTTRDVVWLFEGFHGGLPATWGKTAHWTFAGDSVQTSSPGNNYNTDPEWLDTPFTSRVVPPDNFSMAATVTIQQVVTNSTGDHSAGLEIFDANAFNMNGAGVRCGLEHFDGQGPTLFLVDDFTNGLNQSTSYSWDVNVQYRLTLLRQGSLYTCTVFGPNGASDTKSVSGNSQVVPRNTDNSVDIWAFGASAQYGSVQIAGPP